MILGKPGAASLVANSALDYLTLYRFEHAAIWCVAYVCRYENAWFTDPGGCNTSTLVVHVRLLANLATLDTGGGGNKRRGVGVK